LSVPPGNSTFSEAIYSLISEAKCCAVVGSPAPIQDRQLRVVIAGKSGSGKTYLLRALRSLSFPFAIEFVQRATTRPQRDAEDPSETTSVTRNMFDLMSSDGRLVFCWDKPHASGHPVSYGLSKWSPRSRVVVLPGNDALITDPAWSRFVTTVGEVLVIRLSASQECRSQRLFERSPEIASDHSEVETRLGHFGDREISAPHLEVKTDGNCAPMVLRNVERIIQQAVAWTES
jgi:ribose 1,5-bisphosphokinase PhnN